MAKPNFKFQKRQKELERKTKQEEKLLRKRERETAELEQQDSAVLPPAEEADSDAT